MANTQAWNQPGAGIVAPVRINRIDDGGAERQAPPLLELHIEFQNRIVDLEEVVAHLEQRLQAVMAPSTANKVAQPDNPTAGSPMLVELVGLKMRVTHCNWRLHEMLQRLEI